MERLVPNPNHLTTFLFNLQKTMYRHLIFVVLVPFFFEGCAAPKQLYIPSTDDLTQSVKIDSPPINISVTNRFGTIVASKGLVTNTLWVRFLEEVTMIERTSSRPKQWIPKGSEGKFTDFYTVAHTGEKISCLKIKVQREANWNYGPGKTFYEPLCKGASEEYKWFYQYIVDELPHGRTMDSVYVPFSSRNQIEEFTQTDLNNPTFVRQFIYNGRVGSELKFIYREFSGDFIKPAFTQDVQYDLDQSNTIRFKNLKMRILSASNTEITYILESNF